MLERKASKRRELLSSTEESIIKMNIARAAKGSGKWILADLAALI